MLPISSSLAASIARAMAPSTREKPETLSLYTTVAKSKRTNLISRASATRVIAAWRDVIAKHEHGPAFLRIAGNLHVRWDRVVGFTPSGMIETGYDLTVPGHETFASVDGTILSNTMQFHVPIREEARREALERMLPSRNLLSPANFRSPVHGPTQEYTGGLYYLTTARSTKPVADFASVADALAAIREGRIDETDPIRIH
jgi:hypothetical protein